jgi:hypothetical protein
VSATPIRLGSVLPPTAGSAPVLRRKCACGGSGHECEECKKKDKLQRSAAGGGVPSVAPPLVHDVLRSSGEPLDATTKAFMETSFGHDFSRVRVHTDTRAAESARQVQAAAYTVGQQIVMGAHRPSLHAPEGRSLLAHELTHTLQQSGESGSALAGAIEIGPENDTYERQADAAATIVAKGDVDRSGRRLIGRANDLRIAAASSTLRRRVKVTPPAAVGDIQSHFQRMCPGHLVASGDEIKPSATGCNASTNRSCECLCDTASDAARTYTIDVQAAMAGTSTETLHDKSSATVPTTSFYPHTSVGPNPTISMVASAGSNMEFGAFDAGGRPFWYDNWRILAHELCGHGRLNQTYAGPTGCRPGHDSTVDTENAIAAEHSGLARGHSGDPRQGEAFFNPVGDRKKVVFRQCNGLHYEAP